MGHEFAQLIKNRLLLSVTSCHIHKGYMLHRSGQLWDIVLSTWHQLLYLKMWLLLCGRPLVYQWWFIMLGSRAFICKLKVLPRKAGLLCFCRKHDRYIWVISPYISAIHSWCPTLSCTSLDNTFPWLKAPSSSVCTWPQCNETARGTPCNSMGNPSHHRTGEA